ncbi:MAG: glycosyltransferase family 4 protein [Candidatus Levybacteria bacterium]|nr:glycosyltransferase family 4 protein [Candidatus Levybacteria bacterium]
MKILFFSRLFYPHIGGVEKHVLEVGRQLIEKGHKVTIITEDLSTKDIPVYLQSKGKIPRHEVINLIEVYRIPVGESDWFRKFRIWKEIWKLRNLIKTSDAIHCHDVFFWYLPFRFLFPFKKVFATFHGYESYPLKSKSILMHKISEKLSNGNICIGHFIKKWYGTKPNFVVYGGVEGVKSEKLKMENGNSAIFIGRLDEQTGILTYVNAVKLIRKKIPNFKFEIIGDGKYRKEIEKYFKVLGFQKKTEKYFLDYNFAFVSRYLSILEAMAARRLVFASYDNPLKEDYLRMASFSKYIVIFNSPSELISKVLFYLKNPDKKEKLVESAYEWVKKQTWEKMANIYLKLWNK